MSNFIKFHGLSLSDNSYIENLSLETLSIDPTNVLPFRVWYNTTDNTLKYSDIVDGNVIIRNITNSDELTLSVNSINTTINNEISDRIAADNAITTLLSIEIDDRIADDNTLTTNLATEVTDRTAADVVLTSGLATEVSDRTNADTLLTTNLATEVTDRIAADAVLTTNLTTETTNRIAADDALQNTINDALDLKSDISYVDTLVGSITTTLLDLTDTTLTSPSNGQVLSYDFTNSKWVNTDLPPPLTTLLDLTDTTLSTPTDGQVLSYDTDSNKWVNTNRPGVVGSSINPLDVNSVVESFVFDGNLSLTLSNHISSLENIFVTFDGLLQLTTEYNVGVNTDILVLSGQQPIGTIIEVRHLISPSMDNTTESFISNGETSFTLSESIISDVDIFVTFDGLLQGQSSYGVNGNSLTLTESQPNGVNIGVRKLSSYIITDFDSIDGGTY